MALSFSVGSNQLVNWGFSLGDVATIVGAGRNVGTWLMTHLNDRKLFEWMNVDVDAVFTRKGLVNTVELQQRWDHHMTLLQNGSRRVFEASGPGTAFHRMDRFTWTMTLLTAALDAAVAATDARQILTQLLLLLFEEQESAHDLVDREGPKHIEGWRSASCVRGIHTKTRDLWAELSRTGKHPPGYIPAVESAAIINFLSWLLAGGSRVFKTSSADVFSLAMVLEEIGVLIRTNEDVSALYDESQTVVYYSSDIPYTTAYATAAERQRPGMRIPLTHVEEVGSLFSSDRNVLREIMIEAMNSVRRDDLRLEPGYLTAEDVPRVTGSPFEDEDRDIVYTLTRRNDSPLPRLQGDNYRFVTWFLLQETPAVCSSFLKVIESITQSREGEKELEILAFHMNNQEQHGSRFQNLNSGFDFGPALSYIQAFVLGYWYALLMPLVDSSQLSLLSKEGYGAWAWSSIECLDFLRQIIRFRIHRQLKNGTKQYNLYRYEVLKLIGYLFGGAEIKQLQSSRHGALGVLGKLPVLYSSLLGGTVDSFGKFSLLDVDPTCIPCSISGIVLPGRPRPLDRQTPKSADVRAIAGFDHALFSSPTAGQPDFTTHIEPDWDYDAQTCLVTYRYRGRIIHRLNPRQIDVVIANSVVNAPPPSLSDKESMTNTGEHSPQSIPSDTFLRVSLDEFFGSVAVHPVLNMVDGPSIDQIPNSAYKTEPIAINTIGMPNAFICLLCIYSGWKDDDEAELSLVRSKDEFEDAVRKAKKVLVFCD